MKMIPAFRLLLILSFATALAFTGPGVQAGDPVKLDMPDFNEFEPWLYKETDSVYVINFWATWCAPCVKEIPAFEELNARYSSDKVKVLLVSLDFPNQVESRVLPFMDRLNIQSQVILLDDPYSNRWIGKVSEEWSGAIPATVIYSSGFRGFYEREFTFEELEEIVKPLIK
ncbi:MAG: TlpA disulfide reductase family protein [Bacteroidales bacterium]